MRAALFMGSGRCLLQTFQSPNRIAYCRDVSRLQSPTIQQYGAAASRRNRPQVRFSNASAADHAARRSHFFQTQTASLRAALRQQRLFEVVNLVGVPTERELSVLPRQCAFTSLGANRPDGRSQVSRSNAFNARAAPGAEKSSADSFPG
jgi:hypothetical protein